MLEHLADPNNLPFSVALAVMLLLALVQIVGLGDLFGDHAYADLHFDLHADVDSHMSFDAVIVAQDPIIDGLMKELGLDGSSLARLVEGAVDPGAAAGPSVKPAPDGEALPEA